MKYGENCLIPLYTHHTKEPQKITIIVFPVEEIIFLTSFITVCAFVSQSLGRSDGNIVIFKNKGDNFYHGFLIALNFAFAGAVTTISLRKKNPTMAFYYRRLAVFSALAAAVILTSSAFRRGFVI
ncbi:hypothetical protein ACP275_05G027400 [Erythranthe tilingii]